MAPKAPPRYVPTLTEVVRGTAAGPAKAGESLSEEQLVQRVMQRVDASLERRLREAIAATVIAQTRDLASALHDRIELVVRAAVAEAIEQERVAQAPARK